MRLLIFFSLLPAAVALPEAIPGATVSVDSSCSGYGTPVLTDGTWIEIGHEITQVYGHRDALGNAGNTWVSATTPGVEHWVRLDFPQTVTLNQVAIWWTRQAWWPRAVRVEMLSDANWVALTGPGDWLRPTAQRSLITFAPIQARAIRLLQHPQGGEADRGLLALQEIAAQVQPAAKPGLEGARKLTAEELRALGPVKLERNIARLSERQLWGPNPFAQSGKRVPGDAGLIDGRFEPVPLPAGAQPGLYWCSRHVIDGATLFFAGRLPAGKVALEIMPADGVWLPVEQRLKVQPDQARACLSFSFEPVSARAFRAKLPPMCPPLTEMEVYRYVPAGPNIWPEWLVQDNQFERTLMASGEEPSFARVSVAGLSMTPAYALIGLKDDPREIGVRWDGDIVAQVPVHVSFGGKRERLADSRDATARTLGDGWRPWVEVEGRLQSLHVLQDAFVSFIGPQHTVPALAIRLFVGNDEDQPLDTSVNLTMDAGGKTLTLDGGCLMADGRIVLLADPDLPLRVEGKTLVVTVSRHGGRHNEAVLTFLQPLVPLERGQITWHDAGQRVDHQFLSYWNETLKPAATIDVPEPRVNKLYQAVLAQLFINADGDIMPYGSAPSVYDGNLYGVEEGFAMMALAQSGFAADAERYMDHTYLTQEFLVKVPEYKKYADRHQQYRNGLQPHYAVELYRLTRHRAWIEKHVPLLKQCAEWTIAQRRQTMVEENGQKPLHWGLLPKWSYGGDISELQCYALYANFCCWQGLVDTAWLMDDLGDQATAERYRQEAADYRACLDRAVEGNVLRDRTPPFLPLQLYAQGPVGNDYDQLFIGCLLDLPALEPGGRQERYLTDWMEQDNRTFCLLPRFRRDVGPGGLDGLYGLGYILSKLQQDKVNEFLLGFYAYLAFNMDHTTFASRETNLIYASDLHLRSPYKVPDMSDPVPCSSAVALLLLREMLVMEAPAQWGEPNSELRLLHGTPQAWFEHGKTIRCEDLPTEFGPLSVQVESQVAQSFITATVRPPTRTPWQRIALRLRHPDGKRWKRVLVDGRPHTEADAARELVFLQPGPDRFNLRVEY
jgi:hypothetical protein